MASATYALVVSLGAGPRTRFDLIVRYNLLHRLRSAGPTLRDQPDSGDDLRKAGVSPQKLEVRINLQPLDEHRAFIHRLVQMRESCIPVAHDDVDNCSLVVSPIFRQELQELLRFRDIAIQSVRVCKYGRDG